MTYLVTLRDDELQKSGSTSSEGKYRVTASMTDTEKSTVMNTQSQAETPRVWSLEQHHAHLRIVLRGGPFLGRESTRHSLELCTQETQKRCGHQPTVCVTGKNFTGVAFVVPLKNARKDQRLRDGSDKSWSAAQAPCLSVPCVV